MAVTFGLGNTVEKDRPAGKSESEIGEDKARED